MGRAEIERMARAVYKEEKEDRNYALLIYYYTVTVKSGSPSF
jgi:hypothetical protein